MTDQVKPMQTPDLSITTHLNCHSQPSNITKASSSESNHFSLPIKTAHRVTSGISKKRTVKTCETQTTEAIESKDTFDDMSNIVENLKNEV